MYRLCKTEMKTEKGEKIDFWGIEFCDGEITYSYPDLFEDKNRAALLVEKCNREKLSLCHLEDVLENEIG